MRAMLFITPGVALWSLLPLIASQRLGLGAAGYGVLFGRAGGRRKLSPPWCWDGYAPAIHQRAARAAGIIYAAAMP